MLATGLFDARALFVLVAAVGVLPAAAAAATRGFLPLFLVGGRLTPAAGAGADGSTVVLVTGRLPVTLTNVVAVGAEAAVVVAVTGGADATARGADATARGADAGTDTVAITGTGGVASVTGVTVVAAVDAGTGMMVPVVVPALIASAAFLASFSNIAPMFVLFFSTTGGRGDTCSVEGVDEASPTADGAEAVVGATAGASTAAAALTVVVVVLFATADEAGGGGGLAFG